MTPTEAVPAPAARSPAPQPAAPLRLVPLVAALALFACQPVPYPVTEEAEERRVIETDGAPAAIGPYSQAILVGNTLYLAGQLGMDPGTGELVEGGIEAETRQVMENLGAVLVAAGFDFQDVVQSQVFLADLDEFAAMNAIYGEYFREAPPARATIQAARIPRDARVEIMMTAVRAR